MTANLLSRLQGLTAPDREVDALICVALQYGGPNSEGATNVRTDSEWDEEDVIFEVGSEACCNRTPELTASLDATVALCERVLPGLHRALFQHPDGESLAVLSVPGMGDEGAANGHHKSSLCIALLIAILTALEARDASN